MRAELKVNWTDPHSVLQYCQRVERFVELSEAEQLCKRWACAVIARRSEGWSAKWHFALVKGKLHLGIINQKGEGYPQCDRRFKKSEIVNVANWSFDCRKCVRFWERGKAFRRLVHGSVISLEDYEFLQTYIHSEPIARIKVPSLSGETYFDFQRLEFVRDPRLITRIYQKGEANKQSESEVNQEKSSNHKKP